MLLKDDQLLNFFDRHKNGKITIRHAWTEITTEGDITLEDLFRMFELVREKRANAVTQD